MAKAKVTFISRYDTLTIVVEPKTVSSVKGITVVNTGKRITFENGMFETSDKKEIDFLRAKIDAGNTDFTESEEVQIEE